MKTHHILVLGGGFAGIQAVKELSKKNIPNTSITLVSNKTYFEYYPALYRIVTNASPIEVCVPIADLISDNVAFVNDTINKIDLASKTVFGEKDAYEYDSLVLAVGSQTHYFDIPGVQELSFSFRSLKEALSLKKHIWELFDSHKHPTEEERVSHYHVVIVGGGPTGVELAGDLVAFMKRIAKKMNVDPSLVTIDLIEAAPRILPALPEAVSRKITRRLQKMGVNIFLNRSIMKEDVEQVYMKDMSMKARTVIWTAGTKINKLYTELPNVTFSARRRVEVNEYLELHNWKDVYVIGDGAQTMYTGLAQTALHDGTFIAQHLYKKVTNKKLDSYKPKSIAYALPVGDDWAAFVSGKTRIYGRGAYFLRHVIDFIFFFSWLPLPKVLDLFWQGYKYRKDNDLNEYA